MLENHPIFPERANISLAAVTSPTSINLRTWERGAGLTRACGSAACAAGVLARPYQAHRAQGDGQRARRSAADRMDGGQSHPDDRPGRPTNTPAFTRVVARDLGRYGVTCNAISPGAATRMTATIPQNTGPAPPACRHSACRRCRPPPVDGAADA